MCGQRLSRFLYDAEHKRLAWLREVEEQGMRMLDSNLGAEPGLMPRTPSQRRRSRKRQSSCLKDYTKELGRRRLSRRRSSIKLVSSKPGSQGHQSKEQPLDPSCGVVEPQGNAAAELPALTGEGAAEAPGPSRTQAGYPQRCPGGACEATAREQSPQGDAATEWQDEAPVTGVPAGPTARRGQAAPGRRTSTSTPKAARAGDPAVLQGDGAAPDLGELLLQGSDSQVTTVGPRARRCSGRRSSLSAPHASRGASLAKQCSLASRRESMIRRSISRAMARKAAARESSSASSRVSCQSSLEVFVEEDVAGTRPGLELDPQSERAPEDTLPSSKSTQAASSPAQHSSPPEQQAGNDGGTPVNPNSEPQNKDQERPPCASPQEDPPCIRTRSRKQAMGGAWNGQRPGAQAPSPLDDQHRSAADQTPPSSGAASKVVRPLRSFLQAVQRHPLLPSPGPPRHGGVMRSLIQRSTPTRPNPKGDFVVSNDTLNRGGWRILWASRALTAPSPHTGIVQLWPHQ